MNENKESKQLPNAQVMLHARVLLRDQQGKTFDVTQEEDNCGYGLKGLQWMGSNALDEINRINELLALLGLAAQNRSKMDARLVLRVLEEVRVGLEHSGELGSYVRYTQELFAQAEALPPVQGPENEKAGRSLATLKHAS